MSNKADPTINKNVSETTDKCFHCGLPLMQSKLTSLIAGKEQPMCCGGCKAVADAIVQSGNESYYRFRDEKSQTGRDIVPEFLKQISLYDHPEVQKRFVHRMGDDAQIKQVSLIIEGIVCAACVWLNEQYLQSLPGVQEVTINYATHRASVCWDDDQIKLSDILEAISRIGYLGHPYDTETQQKLHEKQRKQLIRQLGIAGLFGMQVMMFALALYGGDWWGMSDSFRSFFRWVSLILTVPVLLFSARPFFIGAIKDLKLKRAGMDVPVTLGLSLAFAASVWHTLTGVGDVYFDSVVMFVFLLLAVRLFELSARKRSAEKIEELTQLAPALCIRLGEDDEQESIPTIELNCGDRVLVKPGAVIPTDGVLLTKRTLVDESLLTGEPLPVEKQTGDELIGGSYNRDQPLTMKVTQIGQETVLAGIRRLIENAQGFKPRIAELSDRIASLFVVTLLILIAVTVVVWWYLDPSRVLQVAVATLVVTCPCALSLATPAALSAAIGTLTRQGMLVAQAKALEVMPTIDTVVFDKTGTLTAGHLTLDQQLGDVDEHKSAHLAIAMALESHSEHPVAQALLRAGGNHSVPSMKTEELQNFPGQGVSGVVDGERYLLGSGAWLIEQGVKGVNESDEIHSHIIHLAKSDEFICSFLFSDPLREDARATIQQLKQAGVEVRICSGDRETYVASIAAQLEVEEYSARQLPEDKMRLVKQLQQQGRRVAMVGDGINDAPVLAVADLSVSLAAGTDLARGSSDMVINGSHLKPLFDALLTTRKMMRIIRQNFSWAIGYNLLAVPFSMAGLVEPWLAAIGMSLSSLIVVLNALRLN